MSDLIRIDILLILMGVLFLVGVIAKWISGKIHSGSLVMDKVFCIECKHCSVHRDYHHSVCVCPAALVITEHFPDTALERAHSDSRRTHYVDLWVHNRNNDCKNFKPLGV